MIVSLCLGRYELSLKECLQAIFLEGPKINIRVIYNLRLPRILFSCFAGGALAIVGLIFQTIFKNGLASPDLLGTTSGCSLGAIIAILWLPSMFFEQIFAFVGGILSLLFVYYLSKNQRGSKLTNLLVCGLIVQALFTSLIAMLKITADPYQQLGSIEYWLMGGFSDVQLKHVLNIIMIIVFLIVLYKIRWSIQLLSLGEEAITVGLPVKKIRITAFVCCILLISCIVSVAGPVSWVGLLIPHMVRLWMHQPISKVFFQTFLIGGIFVIICDTIARCLFTIEIPISIVTSLFGAMYLIVLLRKGNKIV